MRDDSNANVIGRQTAQGCRSANHRLELLEQLTLSDCKSMQRFVAARGLIHLPLCQPEGNIRGQHLDWNIKPLRCNNPQPCIEVGDDSVEIHTQYKFRVTHSVQIQLDGTSQSPGSPTYGKLSIQEPDIHNEHTLMQQFVFGQT